MPDSPSRGPVPRSSSRRVGRRPGFRRGGRVLADRLRAESVGGALLLVAGTLAVLWANSPFAPLYREISAYQLGPLSLASWAADGLLAVFFFVAGLELKREFVAGDLRDPRRAALPIGAAVGGMVVPAALFVLLNLGGALRGWAIPVATDIAFALAVLAVAGRHLPSAMRTFLLTLAVVDDLLAIIVIAVFYTGALHPLPLLLAVLPLAAFGFLARRPGRLEWALPPLAVLTWWLVHESGVHATVAGVLLAFTVPVASGLAERWERRWRPLSAGFAVPVFAFFAAGVTVGSVTALTDRITVGVVVGLVAGKTLGITGATWLVRRVTRARLEMSWWDVLGLAMLGGVGFTVSLLLGELAYGAGTARDEQAKLGILLGTLIAALLSAVVLRLRSRHYQRLGAGDGGPETRR